MCLVLSWLPAPGQWGATMSTSKEENSVSNWIADLVSLFNEQKNKMHWVRRLMGRTLPKGHRNVWGPYPGLEDYPEKPEYQLLSHRNQSREFLSLLLTSILDFFKSSIYLFHMHWFFATIIVCCESVPLLWNWTYSWWWAAMLLLGTEARSSGRAVKWS